MRRNENFILRRVADMSVIVPLGAAAEAFPGMISVNETGAFLWDLLEQEQTLQSLGDALCAVYSVEREQAEADAAAFLDKLRPVGAEGGHITLTLEKTDRQARLTVSNPGDPIPPEHLAHLFERFYRADASRGEKSGFGLGLAIADTIAREHKGVLKAESDTASTRFTFTMPLKK